MTNTHIPVLNAVRRRSARVHVDVMVKKIGMPPKGSTIGNSARNVAAAEAGSVRRNCPNGVSGAVHGYLYPSSVFAARSSAAASAANCWRARSLSPLSRASFTPGITTAA